MSVVKNQSILQEAEQIINGPRRADYGPAQESFQAIADVWSVQLRKKLRPGVVLEAREIALMMVTLKALREGNQPKRDNCVDIAGYGSLAHLCAQEDEDGS